MYTLNDLAVFIVGLAVIAFVAWIRRPPKGGSDR